MRRARHELIDQTSRRHRTQAIGTPHLANAREGIIHDGLRIGNRHVPAADFGSAGRFVDGYLTA
jgi:hypothetical protein